jgi:hypothetical protein
MNRMLIAILAVLCSAAELHAGTPEVCSVDADCRAVLGARCRGMRCTMASPQELFPNVPGLVEIDLVQPANLAATTATPELRWSPPGDVDLVAVAIMKRPPDYQLRPDQISNLDDAVWIWHSSLPGGSVYTSTLRFEQGRALGSGGDAQVQADSLVELPRPLESGAYYWGVWAWRGLELSHRSELRTFAGGAEDLTGRTSCAECTAPSTARCLQSDPVYCVLACASDVDCYQGMTCDTSSITPRHPWGVCRYNDVCDCEIGYCDPELQLCYGEGGVIFRGELAASGSGCSGAGSPGALLPVLLAWLALSRRPQSSNEKLAKKSRTSRAGTGTRRAPRPPVDIEGIYAVEVGASVVSGSSSTRTITSPRSCSAVARS